MIFGNCSVLDLDSHSFQSACKDDPYAMKNFEDHTGANFGIAKLKQKQKPCEDGQVIVPLGLTRMSNMFVLLSGRLLTLVTHHFDF